MSKSRRQFLTHTSLGLLGAAAAGRSTAQTTSRPAAWGAARVRHGACRWTRGLTFHLRRGGETGAVGVDRGASVRWRQVVGAGPWRRSMSGAPDRARSHWNRRSRRGRTGIRCCRA